MRKWFGTDGIRGVANQYLTPELALQLAQASIFVLNEKEAHERPLVLIGRDTRISGQMFEAAMAAGFCAMGCDVEILDVMPTPAVAWMVKHSEAAMGVMISASHNPAPDNGIKLFNGSGEKLSDSIELQIEKAMDLPDQYLSTRKTGDHVGTMRPISPTRYEDYLQMLTQIIEGHSLSQFKVLIDCAHGATYQIAEDLFKRLDLSYDIIYHEPDGMNINEGCGSTYVEDLKSKVIEEGYDIAFAFDGDGDRCLALGPKGQFIDGDQMMYLLSQYLPEMKDSKTVVATVMSNWGFEEALLKVDKKLFRTKVGDRYVLEELKAHSHLLGGEQSGHIIFTPYQITGDGLLTAILFLKSLVISGRPLTDILEEVPRIPQILQNVKVSPLSHKSWQDNLTFKAAIQASSTDLKGEGRVLVRASGTEPKIRVMVEGKDMALVEKVVGELVAVATSELT